MAGNRVLDMTKFTGIGSETGYSDKSTKPFFIVPSRGVNLLVLRNGKGCRVRPGDSRLAFNELSLREVNGAVRDYVYGMRYLGTNEAEETFKELWTRCHTWMNIGARIFAIGGKGRGLSYVEAAPEKGEKIRVDVAILPHKSFTVAFRMLQHKDGDRVRPATLHTPDQAPDLIAKLNSVFVPQLNTKFELADSRWTVTEPLHQPITEAVFQEYILKDKHPTADVTVFFVGRWKGKDTHPNGTYFTEHDVAAIDDKPIHPEQITIAPVLMTLCHELGHFLQDRRTLVGHHGRPEVLLSSGIQGTLIDKQLVADLNPW